MNERRDCYRVDIDNMRMVTTCGAATVRMIYYNNMKVEGHVESVPFRFDDLHGPVKLSLSV